MFFKSIFKILNNTYHTINDDRFDHVNPSIVKYFRTEYGKDWKTALQHHIYTESIKNGKKAA